MTAPIEASDVSVRSAGASDAEAIAAAFVRSFEGIDPRAARRSGAEWRWRTSAHPHGWRSIVAVRGDEVVAHFGGWRQRANAAGEAFWTSQAIDSFVVPEARAGLWRGRVFAELVAAYVERYCGATEERDRVAWGLPIERAWRLGRSRAGYARMDSLWWLVAEAASIRGGRAPGIQLRETERVPEGIDRLSTDARDSRARLHRDAAWLAWRYDARPDVRYRSFSAVRASGEPAGYCAWRCGRVDEMEGALLCTWLADPRDADVSRALLASVAEAARSAGAERVAALVSPRAGELALFQDAGFRLRPARRFLGGRSFDERWSLDRIGHGLDVQLGDTDLA